MNNSLLADKEFETLIKKEINNFEQIYSATPYHPDYIDSISHGFELMVTPTLFWETFLVSLRGSIIYYSKQKKAAKRRAENKLTKEIEQLDNKVSSGQASEDEILHLRDQNINLTKLRKEDLKGA